MAKHPHHVPTQTTPQQTLPTPTATAPAQGTSTPVIANTAVVPSKPTDPSQSVESADSCAAHALGLCISNKIDLGLAVPFLILAATVLISRNSDRRKEARDKAADEEKQKAIKRQYLVALREEIGLNIELLVKSQQRFPSRADFEGFFKKENEERKRPGEKREIERQKDSDDQKENGGKQDSDGRYESGWRKANEADRRPLVTFSFNSKILTRRIEILQDLPDILIKNIIDFYGKLDEIGKDCDSIESAAFPTISRDGRIDTLLDIRSQIDVATQLGKALRDAISQHLSDRYDSAPATGSQMRT